MKREYRKPIKSKKAFVSVVSILLILSFIVIITANTPLAMARSHQDTATEQADTTAEQTDTTEEQAGGSEYQTIRSFPGKDKTETVTPNKTQGYFHYYVEALPGTENTRTYNEKEFIPYNEDMETVENDSGTVDDETDFFLIEGFERWQAATADGKAVAIGSHTSWDPLWNHDLYFYYLRRSDTVEFVDTNDNRIILDESVLYRDRLEDKVPAVPDPPDGCRFTGWYADPDCTTALFFHEPTQAEIDAVTGEDGEARYQVYDRMPAGTLRIYAGWETVRDNIGIDPDGGERSSAQSTFLREPYHGDPIEEYGNASGENEELSTAKTISDAAGGTVTDPENAAPPENAGDQTVNGVPPPEDDPPYDDSLTVKSSVSETQSDLLDHAAGKQSSGTDTNVTGDTDAASIDSSTGAKVKNTSPAPNTGAKVKNTSPAPVTGAEKQAKSRDANAKGKSIVPITGFGEQAAPYIVVPAIILMAAVLVVICRKKGGKQHESSSL